MYYKNYMINYSALAKNVIIAKMSEDIPQNPSGEWILGHTIKLFEVPRYEIENCKEHLASNGLYLGIFPCDFIENGIQEYNKHQEEFRKQVLKDSKQTCSNIWEDKDFEELNDGKHKLSDILKLINNVNKLRVVKYNLEPIDIDKEYGKYLKKYWGEEYEKSTK